jgi:hypothetical protein
MSICCISLTPVDGRTRQNTYQKVESSSSVYHGLITSSDNVIKVAIPQWLTAPLRGSLPCSSRCEAHADSSGPLLQERHPSVTPDRQSLPELPNTDKLQESTRVLRRLLLYLLQPPTAIFSSAHSSYRCMCTSDQHFGHHGLEYLEPMGDASTVRYQRINRLLSDSRTPH